MIGIIGPSDSIALVIEVASEMENLGSLVTRSYSRPEASLELTREIESLCDVILFTGRLPYAMAFKDSQSWHPKLQFIPHTGTDLYRTLARILRENNGIMPRTSIDTIDANWVAETFGEIGLPVPEHLMPFSEIPEGVVPTREDVLAFHVSQWEAGTVDACLTCLGVVYNDLQELGIPSWRIEHTRPSLRRSLEHASMAAELAQSRSTHMALALVRLPTVINTDVVDPYLAQIKHLRIQEMAVQMSQQMRGQLVRTLDTEFLITTSRGMVDETMSRLRTGQRSAIDVPGLPEGTRVGFGVGLTAAAADENARRAVELSERIGSTHAILTDGEVISSGGDSTLRMREVQPAVRAIAESLGLGPLSFTRLLSALRRLDLNTLTARQLADVYGIEARSARRLLGALLKAGFASETGREVSAAAGRPQSVFSVDMQALLNAIDGAKIPDAVQ